MAFEELVGKHVLVVTPMLNTPPEKKLFYLIGTVEEISGPMLKLSGCKYTHFEDKVWAFSYAELQKKEFMRNGGLNGTCWVYYYSEKVKVYPFGTPQDTPEGNPEELDGSQPLSLVESGR